MGVEAANRFLFRIDDVFTITGRGTVVAGFLEQGAVRAAIVCGSSAVTAPRAWSSYASQLSSLTGPGGGRAVR